MDDDDSFDLDEEILEDVLAAELQMRVQMIECRDCDNFIFKFSSKQYTYQNESIFRINFE